MPQITIQVMTGGHRKSCNFTDGVGRRTLGTTGGTPASQCPRQYIGEIGTFDNGIVVVTTHLYDGTLKAYMRDRTFICPATHLTSRGNYRGVGLHI